MNPFLADAIRLSWSPPALTAACHSAECAPPPAGSGGSLPGSTSLVGTYQLVRIDGAVKRVRVTGMLKDGEVAGVYTSKGQARAVRGKPLGKARPQPSNREGDPDAYDRMKDGMVERGTWRSRPAARYKSMTAALTAACHEASCRPPTSGGTGGSLPKSVNVSVIRGDIQRERKAVLAELDKQGLPELAPLRHIFQSWMGDTVVVVRNERNEVVGGAQVMVSPGTQSVTVRDMRMNEERSGHGTAAFQEIAKIAVERDFDLGVTNAVSSAIPFYAKLGAYFREDGHSGEWTDETRNALAEGKPKAGAFDMPANDWLDLPLWAASQRPRRRKTAK